LGRKFICPPPLIRIGYTVAFGYTLLLTVLFIYCYIGTCPIHIHDLSLWLQICWHFTNNFTAAL